ncbi:MULTISPECIES: hypothetical protein [Streptomyces]|uniref:hypothetical protein n=1 Tax=Streptomyces TaxID=1883 RepID=UPI000B9E6EAD|nr:hypothetical protein [Streptomyces kasugaensis]
MKREYVIRDTEFTRWLLDRARTAGWDVNGNQEVQGALRMTAALIRTSGIDAVDIQALAQALAVSVKEIETASRSELDANRAQQALLDRPDMAELDEHLDATAWPDGHQEGR